MNKANITCVCLAATDAVGMVRGPEGQIRLQEFSALREKCLALREILLPEEVWPKFRHWHVLPDEEASHASVALLAFWRGCLPQVTRPIHDNLLSPTGILCSVSKQYVKDLQEKWMFDANAAKRHRLSRIFRGRLIELQFASWLQSQSHTIVGLEATREGPDIETLSPTGEAQAFEVKFIGVEDGDFKMILKSMGGHPAGGAVSPYRPVNYLLFRVYEAASQLKAASGQKNVVIVIDESGWRRFAAQIKTDRRQIGDSSRTRLPPANPPKPTPPSIGVTAFPRIHLPHSKQLNLQTPPLPRHLQGIL